MTRYYSATAQDTTVTSAITSSSTTVVVGATTNFPTQYPFILALDFGAASEELVQVTTASGLTLTITRGYNGSTAQSHSVGAVVRHVATAQDFTDAQNHYATALTAGAHGVTGSLATFLGSPTSANLASYLTDETGSGPAVFATGPSISGPTISNPVITGTITASGSTGSAGQFLSSTGTGIAWAAASADLAFNAQTGTTYTLVSSDKNKVVTLSNASAVTLTIPSAVFTTGQQINIQQIGAGQVTVQGDGTSTFTGTGTKLRAQYSAATIVCTGTNTFTLIGDLA
jgi:hypothetical protein